MKRGLRRTHRAMMLVLIVVVPALVVLALRARRPPAVMEQVPEALSPAAGDTP